MVAFQMGGIVHLRRDQAGRSSMAWLVPPGIL